MIAYLDGEQIYNAFMAGATEVNRQREHLNKINVFPIPDGDTGNNLVVTLNSLASVQPQKAVGSSLRSIAKATLAGARGNSGIIFAQFVNGLTLELGDHTRLSTQGFGEMVSKAIPHAYRAISNPVEGTMITVMKDWAEAVHAVGAKTSDFVELFSSTIEVARESLKATPQKLKVLRDALVVDSGAQGFVLFLEGFAKFLHNGLVEYAPPLPEIAVISEESLPVDGNLIYRYCTEAYITGNAIDLEGMRASAEGLGDSVIVAGGPGGARVHVHTNQPADLFTYLRGKGHIAEQKVEDMLRQYSMAHDRKYPIALVTDSIADLPEELFDQYQVHLIPLNLLIEGSNYYDKTTMKPDRFYDLLDELQEYPTTSQPNQTYVEEVFSSLKKHYESIVVISVSQALSGTFSVFQKAAQKLGEDGYSISVINSRLNSGAQGLLVLKAAESIAAGLSHQEVVATTEEAIARTKIYVGVNTFKYMVRGGRVSPMKGLVANLLNMKPIVSLDSEGRGLAFGSAFSQKGNTKKIVDLIKKIQLQEGIERYCIVHANALEKAQSLGAQLTRELGISPHYITEISPIVGLSAGIGSVAVSITKGSKTEEVFA